MTNNIYNIISNNCIGARYYQNNHIQFQNPFMWNLIKLSDFIFLIENFDKIDFNNIKLYFSKNEVEKDHDTDKCSTILLDNYIHIYFIHHHYTQLHKCQKSIRITGNDYEIIGNDILEYLKNKWINRVNRLKKNNNIIFVYYDIDNFTNTNINKLFNIKSQYKIILFSNTNYKDKCTKTNNIFYIKPLSNNTNILAEQLSQFIKNNFK